MDWVAGLSPDYTGWEFRAWAGCILCEGGEGREGEGGGGGVIEAEAITR